MASAGKGMRFSHYKALVEEAEKGALVKIGPNISTYCSSVGKLKAKGDECLRDGDEELAFVYYFRAVSITTAIQGSKEYLGNKKKFEADVSKCAQLVGGILNTLDGLKKTLKARYEEKEKQENKEKVTMPVVSSPPSAADEGDITASLLGLLPDVPTDTDVDRELGDAHVSRVTDEVLREMEKRIDAFGNARPKVSAPVQPVSAPLPSNKPLLPDLAPPAGFDMTPLFISTSASSTNKSSPDSSSDTVADPSSLDLLFSNDRPGAPLQEAEGEAASKLVVTCTELFGILKDAASASKTLLLDTRPADEYRISHIEPLLSSIGRCNVPATVLRPGISSMDVARALQEKHRALFEARERYENIIIITSSQAECSDPQSPSNSLKDAIYKYEGIKILKAQPRLLLEGYDTWYEKYPAMCSGKPPKKKQSQERQKPGALFSMSAYPTLAKPPSPPPILPPAPKEPPVPAPVKRGSESQESRAFQGSSQPEQKTPSRPSAPKPTTSFVPSAAKPAFPPTFTPQSAQNADSDLAARLASLSTSNTSTGLYTGYPYSDTPSTSQSSFQSFSQPSFVPSTVINQQPIVVPSFQPEAPSGPANLASGWGKSEGGGGSAAVFGGGAAPVPQLHPYSPSRGAPLADPSQVQVPAPQPPMAPGSLYHPQDSASFQSQRQPFVPQGAPPSDQNIGTSFPRFPPQEQPSSITTPASSRDQGLPIGPESQPFVPPPSQVPASVPPQTPPQTPIQPPPPAQQPKPSVGVEPLVQEPVPQPPTGSLPSDDNRERLSEPFMRPAARVPPAKPPPNPSPSPVTPAAPPSSASVGSDSPKRTKASNTESPEAVSKPKEDSGPPVAPQSLHHTVSESSVIHPRTTAVDPSYQFTAPTVPVAPKPQPQVAPLPKVQQDQAPPAPQTAPAPAVSKDPVQPPVMVAPTQPVPSSSQAPPFPTRGVPPKAEPAPQLPMNPQAMPHRLPPSTPSRSTKPQSAEAPATFGQYTAAPSRASVDRSLKPSAALNRPSVDRSVKPVAVAQNSRISPGMRVARVDSMDLVEGSLGKVLTGLKNLGNTCFMNSVLQCLVNTIPLSTYFVQGRYRGDLNLTNPMGTKGQLAEEYGELVLFLFCGRYRALAPRFFKSVLEEFAPQFSGFQQHDCQEFASFLLDGLHEDLNRNRGRKAYVEDPDTEGVPDTIAANKSWENYKLRNDSVVVDLFQGQFKSCITCCTCGYSSVTFSPFMFLSLPLPPGSRVTLDACLALFSREERVSGSDEWRCPKCKCPREAIKSLRIWKLPPILLIHLKRFSFDGPFRNKLQTMVDFPLTDFDAGRHSVGPNRSLMYDLYGVCNHFGSLSGGHYIATCKNVYANTWYQFDDHVVRPVAPSTVCSNAGYLLFYTSVDFKHLVPSFD